MNEEAEPSADPVESVLRACLREGNDRSSHIAALRADGSAAGHRVARLLSLLDGVGFLREPDEPDPRLPARIGDYRVLQLLGSGGMGVVYLAEHERLGRRAALKVIHRDFVGTERARARFQREALAVSRLDHPGLCTVYEVGSDGEQPFLAMRFVQGRDLAEYLAETRVRGEHMVALPGAQQQVPAILQFGERAAEALHAAHEAGLVHRDVKPGNLMVTPGGEPVLLDFGLAQFDDTETPSLTRSGDRLGTPAYMAPEQVAGTATDRRTDVYALAATMYEMLTGRAPHTAPTRESLYRHILAGDVTPLRRHDRRLGRDLEVVIATALDREPDRRYRTAADFAEDLRRVRLMQPINARRPSPWTRVQRFAQRNPAVTTLLAGLVLASGVLTWLWSERGDALQQREHALGSARAIEMALRASDGRMAPVPSLTAAIAAVEKEQNVDTLSALYAATLSCREVMRLQPDHMTGSVIGSEFHYSPRGDLLLTPGFGGAARLWNRAGQRVGVMWHSQMVNSAVFSTDGQRVLTASMDGRAAVWELSGRRLFWLVHGDPVRNPEFGWIDPEQSHCVLWASWSPDGRRIATGCSDRSVWFWDPDTGAPVGPKLTHHRGPPMHHAWSPDSALLASAECDAGLELGLAPAQVLVYRTEPPHELVAHLVHPRAVHGVQFSPDARHLLTACLDGHVRLFQLQEGKPEGECVLDRELGGMILRADFSADGERVLACSSNGTVGLWRSNGEQLRRRAFDVATRVGFAADDQIIGFGAANSVLQLDGELRERQVFVGHSQPCGCVTMSPDGRQLASVSEDMTVRLWDLVDADLPRLLGHDGRVISLMRLDDGSILSTGEDGTARIWDLQGQQIRAFPIAAGLQVIGLTVGAVLDRERQRLAAANWEGTARVYDMVNGKLLYYAPAPGVRGRGCAMAWLGDGRLVVGGLGRELLIYAPDGQSKKAWPKPSIGVTLALQVAKKRDRLFASGWGATISVWDLQGQFQHQVGTPMNSWIHVLAVSTDEQVLAAGDSDHLVRLWQLREEGPPAELPASPLRGHDTAVKTLAWSPDGRWFASGSSDGSVRLWDTSRWTSVAVLRGHDRGTSSNAVNALLFTSDSRLLLSAGDDGAIQAWPTDAASLLAIAKKKVARVESGTPPTRRYLELLEQRDLTGAAAAGKEIVDTAIAIRDVPVLARIAWEIVDPKAARPARDLDLAERAITGSLGIEPDAGGDRIDTLARVHYWRGNYRQALAEQTKAAALSNREDIRAVLHEYEELVRGSR